MRQRCFEFYAQRSPIFMAARFDASRAKSLQQSSGDGTPIMLTIPTDQPWVPLRILSLGLGKAEPVEADVFLLTDNKPELLIAGDGLEVQRTQQANSGLLTDLRSDKGMGWVPEKMWFTYLQVDGRASDLDYDLAISVDPKRAPSAADAGVIAASPSPGLLGTGGRDAAGTDRGLPVWPLALAGATAVIVVAFAAGKGAARRTTV